MAPPATPPERIDAPGVSGPGGCRASAPARGHHFLEAMTSLRISSAVSPDGKVPLQKNGPAGEASPAGPFLTSTVLGGQYRSADKAGYVDELTEERVYELLHLLQNSRDMTVILVCHDLTVVDRMQPRFFA